MDPKPARRIHQPEVYAEFHDANPGCIACPTYRGVNAHHIIPKSQGGDDVLENLVGLCGSGAHGCHGAFHGNPSNAWGVRIDHQHVSSSIGSFLLSEAGDSHRHYILRKLGWDAGWAYMERHFGVDREVAA